MSELKYIVADCGGTSTNWAFCYEESEVTVKTETMHPKYLLESGQEKRDSIRAKLPEDVSAPLYFYSSGCTNTDIAGRMQEVLTRMGFSDVTVLPDTIGACRACCGDSPGRVAILGTGSVLLDYDGQEVTGRTGGWGSLIGDEGGGFHFGRLLLQAYLSGRITDDWLPGIIGTEQEIQARLATPDAQRWISTLAAKTAGLDLTALHRTNIRAFINMHLQGGAGSGGTLAVVGSYGWYQRDVLAEELSREGWECAAVIRDPLPKLVIYHS